MVGSVACRSIPEVERDEAGSPCDLAGGPVLATPELDGGPKVVPISPEVERALLSCLSLHICTLSELKGQTIEVFGVEIYKHDAVVRRRVRSRFTAEEARMMIENGWWMETAGGGGHKPPRGRRNKITRTQPRAQSLLEFQRVVKNSDVQFRSFLTLTYGKSFPVDGRIVAKHQHAFHTALRRRYDNLEYSWMKEFQRRGAAHFHYLTEVGEDDIDREWLGETWARITRGGEPVRWQHTRPEVWSAFRKQDGAIRYIGKYLRKAQDDEENQKEVPVDKGWKNWGRWWGMSRGIKAEPIKFVECNAQEIAEAVGFESSNRFLKDCADGKKRFRTILWDQSEKFQ